MNILQQQHVFLVAGPGRRKCYNMVMLMLQLFAWWYVRGWQDIARASGTRLIRVAHLFSVPILMRTLWAPWRRIITYPGASIDAKLRAIGDNLVSRAIGFTVRLLVLITAALILLLTATVGLIVILLWPLIPPAALFFLGKGLVG
jgi:hypothetical protein